MTLYLLPNLLDEGANEKLFLPPIVEKILPTLKGLIAESERGARRYLRRFSLHLPISLLNEHTHERDCTALLVPLAKGEDWGLISDAGMPCIADPGSKLVFLARQKGIEIEAIAGPSSIMLALILSGLGGQCFTFHGYLSREKPLLAAQLREMEKQKGAHLFIEAPYRNQRLLETVLEVLHPETFLSIAWDLTTPSQGVITDKVSSWKKKPLPPLDGKPALFTICVKKSYKSSEATES